MNKRPDIPVFLLILLLLTQTSAHAVMFTWKDSHGTSNYTNREDEIPARYKARTRILYPDQLDSKTTRQITSSDDSATQFQRSHAISPAINNISVDNSKPTSRKKINEKRMTREKGIIED